MFIVPMDAEGVTVRGLRQISGEAEFNEVFFDDVALDAGAVVGGVGNGWGTALTTLMFERVTIGLGGEGMGYNSTRFAAALAADEHARRDPEVRHQLGEIASELLAVRFTGYRTLTALQKGQIPGPEAGLAKVTIVNGAIKAGDLIADVLGPDALAEDSEWAYMISFLPGLKSAGGTEEILRNTDRRARARAAARAAAGQGHPLLGAALQGRGGGMNLALSDEQVFLREAARGALSRFKTLEAAREALDGDASALPDLWPTACEAGWPGLLIDESHGGAGLDVFDAMLVLGECGRVLAGDRRCSATCPRRAILGDAGAERAELLAAARHAASAAPPTCPCSPPDDLDEHWSADPRTALRRAQLPRVGHGAAATAARQRRALRSCPTRPAPTCSWASRCSTASPSAWRSRPTRAGVRVEAVDALRRHPLARARHA